jgi:hypothetical protein
VEERSLPPWVWFAWIPQLLTSLTRPEARRVKPILRQLAEVWAHRQAPPALPARTLGWGAGQDSPEELG